MQQHLRAFTQTLSSPEADVDKGGGRRHIAIQAYVLVTLEAGSEKDVLQKISSFEEVTEVGLLYGEYDAIVKLRVEHLSQLDAFLTEKLRAMPDVFLTATMIVAKEYRG